MPHVYQINADSNQATPVIVPEAVQQETNNAIGSGIGSLSDVNVKELRVITNQQVRVMATPILRSTYLVNIPVCHAVSKLAAEARL